MDPNAPQPTGTDERTQRRLRELAERLDRLEAELRRLRKEANVNGHA